jgi:hypothetical protein
LRRRISSSKVLELLISVTFLSMGCVSPIHESISGLNRCTHNPNILSTRRYSLIAGFPKQRKPTSWWKTMVKNSRGILGARRAVLWLRLVREVPRSITPVQQGPIPKLSTNLVQDRR